MSIKWKNQALGELIKPKKEKCSVDPQRAYKEVTVALWGKGTRLRGNITGEEIEDVTRYIANEGDFIISKIDARHGAYGIIPKALDNAVVTSDFPLYQIKNKALNIRWLYWCSKSKWFIDECKRASQGTTNRVRLKISLFEEIEIPLPPVEEQDRIVSHLDAIESRLQNIHKLRDESEKEQRALKNSLFNHLCKGAKHYPMSEIAPLIKRDVTIDLDQVYREYGIRSFYKGIFHRRSQLGSQYEWQKLYTLREGDVVFSNIMAWEKSIGLALPHHEGWVGNHRMLTCHPNKNIALPLWVYQYFNTSEGFQKILAASPGTVARNRTLRAKNLMNIQIPIPSLEIQQLFQQSSIKIGKSMSYKECMNIDIEAILPSSLRKVFNGK